MGSGQLPSGPAALDDAQSCGQPRPHCTPATPLAPRPTSSAGRRGPRAPGGRGRARFGPAHTPSGRHSHVVQVPGAEEDPALPVPVGVDGVFGDTVVHVERTLGRDMTGEAVR